MVFAQIKDNRVVNCIVLNNLSLSSLFSVGFDHFIRIDNINPRPGIGWSYDGASFSAPVQGED